MVGPTHIRFGPVPRNHSTGFMLKCDDHYVVGDGVVRVDAAYVPQRRVGERIAKLSSWNLCHSRRCPCCKYHYKKTSHLVSFTCRQHRHKKGARTQRTPSEAPRSACGENAPSRALAGACSVGLSI